MFLVLTDAAVVREPHRHPILRQVAQRHAHQHFVVDGQLGHVLAGASGRDQAEVAAAERIEHLRRVLAQEELATAPLPAHMVGIVDIADQIAFNGNGGASGSVVDWKERLNVLVFETFVR